MFNDFEIKLNEKDNWTIRYLHVFHGISVADSENEYKKGNKIVLDSDCKMSINKEFTSSGDEYFVLSIESKDKKVFIRAHQKIALEYIIYNSQQINEQNMGRPMTFNPHLINIDSPLYSSRIENFHFRGLINLIVLALIFSHLRLMYDNFIKTGLMLSTEGFINILGENSLQYLIISAIFILLSITFSYLIEKLAGGINNENIIQSLNFLNLGGLLGLPVVLHYLGYYNPLLGQFVLFVVCIVFLKLYSFNHFWNDVRKFMYKKENLKSQERTRRMSVKNLQKLSLNEEKEIEEHVNKDNSLIQKNDKLKESLYEEIDGIVKNYPNNVKFFDLFVFLFMPVLCYQYKFPRTNKIRISYLINYGTKVIVCLFLQ